MMYSCANEAVHQDKGILYLTVCFYRFSVLGDVFLCFCSARSCKHCLLTSVTKVLHFLVVSFAKFSSLAHMSVFHHKRF